MMEIVVNEGYGSRAAVRGMRVGGKTGTAQLGANQPPHAWFIGFAESGDQSVVMAIVIENGGEGSQAAAPIFAQLAEQAMQVSNRPAAPPPLPPPIPPTQPAPLPPAGTPQAGQPATPVAQTPGAPVQPTPDPRSLPVPLEPDILYRPDGQPFFERVSDSCPERAEGAVGSGQFGWPSTYQFRSGGEFREGHAGIDFGAPAGTPVYAADTGNVLFAGWTGATGYGNAVVIDHGNGFYTLYAHLSQVSTRCGVAVDKGDRIAMSGNTGNSTGPHLHFEVRVATGYVNPLRVLPTP
jgi:murein DD-endopeptidase MepM/ murein hydrolase activator NlpD